MKVSNKFYDIAKWIAMIALNALGTAYKALAAIWGWPFGEEVMQTCAIVAACLGILLGISTAEYRKGAGK